MQTRITPEKLARVWGCGPELIRVGMREGKLPIGQVIKHKRTNTYLIFIDRVCEFCGMTREQLMERLKEVEK